VKYAALLRGINVGTSKRIDMKDLKLLFERNGCTEVTTYINSGNIIFESGIDEEALQQKVEELLFTELNQKIRTLIVNRKKIVSISDTIPPEWNNDDSQKTDVAYLFKEANFEKTLELLPVDKDYIRLIYVDGAIIWNVDRGDYNKSKLNKIISHKIYKEMTVRNVNTARYLASLMR
jgi:uncharacterized protein (DUF1697 family)